MSTATATAGGVPYRVPPEPSRWSAMLLACVVHAVLLFFLWHGIRWTSEKPLTVEAEVWDTQIQQAAPPPVPVPEPEPTPPAKVEEELPPPKPPEIKIEKEKPRKPEPPPKPKEDDKVAKAKKAAEDKALQKAREEEMRRITGAVGTTTGTAPRSTAPRGDPSYYGAIGAKIKSNLNYTGSTDVPGDPTALFQIDQLPNGEILSRKKLKSSGVPAYDDAIEKTIDKSSPLPKKKDGTVDRSVQVEFRLKENR